MQVRFALGMHPTTKLCMLVHVQMSPGTHNQVSASNKNAFRM